MRPMSDRVAALQDGQTASTAAFIMHHVLSRVETPVSRQIICRLPGAHCAFSM